MRVLQSAAECGNPAGKVCLAIGFFDGVHLGHQQIIRQTITDARQHEALSVVVTFDRHPNTVVAPDRVPRLIYTLPQRIRTIESLGADALLLVRFDSGFSRQTGQEFIHGLVRDFGGLQSVCVGANFVFGHKRGGNVAVLRELGREFKFAVHGLAAVSLDEKPVSSTRIREAISAGDLDFASQMLGRAYAISGVVMRGDELGRKLGFPTANLACEGMVLPPRGVYAAQVMVNQQLRRAVLNIGFRPTLGQSQPQLRVEAHIIDFEGDLYGRELEVSLGDKLRDEMKFGSLRELKEQIARDILEAMSRWQ
jgi:riboflavin kinase/FMN adenylyltransferase